MIVVNDINVLIQYKEEWDKLFEKCVYTTPFQEFDFIFSSLTCLKENKEKLYILIVENKNTKAFCKFSAILPTCITKMGELRFINAAHIDFCSSLVLPECDNYSLYQDIARYISSDKKIKYVNFENLKADNPLVSALKPFFKLCLIHDQCYYSSVPVIPLETDKDTIDAFRHLNAKEKKNLRVCKSKNTENSDFYIFRHENGDMYPSKHILYLVEHMIDEGIRKRKYFSDSMLQFWERLYECDLLVVSLLCVDGEVKSCNFMYHDKKRNEYIKWIMLYVANKWNMVINLMIQEQLYKDGGGIINFARGIYDYKMVNFHPNVSVLFRVFLAKSYWSFCLAFLRVSYYFMKVLAKKIIRG